MPSNNDCSAAQINAISTSQRMTIAPALKERSLRTLPQSRARAQRARQPARGQLHQPVPHPRQDLERARGSLRRPQRLASIRPVSLSPVNVNQ
eukprot:5821444-Lingulodinium_polyedra.AAC.1